MSGSGLAPWSLVSNPAKYAAIVAHHVNCASDLPPAPGSPAAQAQAQESTAAGNGLGGEAGIAAAGGWGTPGQLENIGEFQVGFCAYF